MDRVKKIIESNEMVVHLDTIEGIYRQVGRLDDIMLMQEVLLTNHFLS